MLIILFSIASSQLSGWVDPLYRNQSARYPHESQEINSLTVRLNYGQFNSHIKSDSSFNFGELPDGDYFLDIPSSFFIFQKAFISVHKGFTTFTIMNPLTETLHKLDGRVIRLGYLGKVQFEEGAASWTSYMSGLIFNPFGMAVLMMGLVYVMKGIMPQMEQSIKPGDQQGQQQQDRLKK